MRGHEREMLNRPAVSRRDVLRALGVTAGAVSLSAFLAACGGDDDDPPSTLESAEVATTTASDAVATPTESGAEATSTTIATEPPRENRPVLRVGVQELPPALDPHQELSNVGTRVTYALFDHLLERDFVNGDPPGTGSNIVPMIAESWERNDDLTMTFKLRKDVRFHNGDPLTAEDIKFSFERHLINPPEELVEAQGYVSTFASVDVEDDYTVRITTTKPDPLLEIRLTSWATWILPKSYYAEVGIEGFARAPVGTGPYKFVELRPDEILILEAFDEWWGGLPTAQRVEFRVLPELAGRLAALVSGEVDLITNIPPDQVETLEGADDVEVRSVPLANCHVIRYNTNFAPLNDRLLRQAMNLAIDRDLLVEALWGGRALLMRSHQFPEYEGEVGGDQYNERRPFLPFDPERAKELVTQSSYGGESIVFRTSPFTYTNGANAAQAIVQMWQTIGINAHVELINNPYQDGVDAIQVVNWSNSSFVADPDGAFWLRWGEQSGTQPAFWTPEDPHFNELGNAARETLDVEFRFDAYQEMLDIWEEEAPGTVLYIPIENYGVRTAIEWIPYSFYYMDLRPDVLRFT